MGSSVAEVSCIRTRVRRPSYVPCQQCDAALCSLAPIEGTRPLKLGSGIADRLLIARLDINPETMSCVLYRLSQSLSNSHYSDDLEYLPALATLPSQQTVFEYLVGCWKRQNAIRATLSKKVMTLSPTKAESNSRIELLTPGRPTCYCSP